MADSSKMAEVFIYPNFNNYLHDKNTCIITRHPDIKYQSFVCLPEPVHLRLWREMEEVWSVLLSCLCLCAVCHREAGRAQLANLVVANRSPRLDTFFCNLARTSVSALGARG